MANVLPDNEGFTVEQAFFIVYFALWC